MSVLVEGAAEACASAYVEMSDLGWIGDRRGEWVQWSGVGDSLMRSMGVVEAFEFPEGVEQVALIPDQGAVQQFATAALYPPLHDRVHPGHSDAAEHDLDSRVGEDSVEPAGGTCRPCRGSGTGPGSRCPPSP